MRLLPLALLAALLASAACGGQKARVPDGIVVVVEEAPPPPGAVALAQRRLQTLGLYHGPIDGRFGPALRVALARLQRERGMPVTGRLDAATAARLGVAGILAVPAPAEVATEPEAPLPGPSAGELLALGEVPVRKQPPPEALESARAEAARLLDDAVARAAARMAGAEEEPLAARSVAAAEAAALLEGARSRAFQILLEARRAGGWAPLPEPLLRELERALAARALLLRSGDGQFGPDDAAAIRWAERSFGLEPTGEPSLRLLEALGIDPAPMFAAP